MATSNFITHQYTSEEYVESAGAILFDFSPEPKVCLIHYLSRNQWLLPKGRRNCGESRHETALREVQEETGYPCRLYPVTMSTRAPAATDDSNTPDRARPYSGLTEPFMLTIRNMGVNNTKLIWWYIAEVDKDALQGEHSLQGEASFAATFLSYEDALQRLTFEDDRNVLRRSILLVKESTVKSPATDLSSVST